MPRAMLTDSQPPESPRSIIFGQVDRFLVARSAGKGGAQTIEGLISAVEPYKNDAWYADMARIRDTVKAGTCHDPVWEVFRAVIRLLDAKNLWANAPREVKEGRELLEAI